MKSAAIRSLFLNYFKKAGHTLVPSSSLIPAGDQTLLFTNAGMVQFKDVFLGREKRPYTRAASVQCCIRAGGKHNDLENVGYTARHHTFFEMLGNFSFGDYFKRDAIRMAWDFLTKELKLPPEKLWVTVYKDDDEAADIWLNEMKVSAERFSRCDEANFWAMGDTGPCGPCTEIFYDHGPQIAGGPPGSPDEDGDRYVEIWNLVFMQFNRSADGQLSPLPKPSVDTGMGLERLAAVMQGVHSNYDNDIFQHLMQAAARIAGLNELNEPSLKVIADHVRSSAFLIMEGSRPSNEGRGYVLRRIIRRALRHGHKLGMPQPFFSKLVQSLIEIMGEAYPGLSEKKMIIEKVLNQEEEQFSKTLSFGMELLEQTLAELQQKKVIPGEVIFKLYDTYGFPVDLTADIAREKEFIMDMEGFEAAMQRQREMSQKASNFKTDYNKAVSLEESSHFHGYEKLETAGKIQTILNDQGEVLSELTENKTGGIVLDHTPFYAESGGQIGDTGILIMEDGSSLFEVHDTQKINEAIIHHGVLKKGCLKSGDKVIAKVNETLREATRIHHSATHLLHAALRDVLGHHVEQKGSIVTPEKTRFDFSHNEALTSEQVHAIERWVNEKVLCNAVVDVMELPFEEAKKSGAMALFGEKYGDKVRVLAMGDFSKELCGGTHVERTGDIGFFKIISESGIASGIRRIEAIAGMAAFDWVQKQNRQVEQVCRLLHCNAEQMPEKIGQVIENQKQTQKVLEQLQSEIAAQQAASLKPHKIGSVDCLIELLPNTDLKALRVLMDSLKGQFQEHVIVLTGTTSDMVQVIAGVSKNLLNKVPDAKALVQMICEKGGGREDLAQGGAKKPQDLEFRLKNLREKIETALGER